MASRALIVLFATFACSCSFGSPPSDSKLITAFQAHREQIDVIVKMIRADRVLLRVDDDWTMPANPAAAGINAHRIDEYRQLLRKVGYSRGFYYRPETGEIQFVAWAAGTVASGGSKSVIYSPRRPAPIVANSADTVPAQQDGSWLAYREIEPNWYIESQQN
jgi:hypothetical protein